MRVRHLYPSASCRREVLEPTSFHLGATPNWLSLCPEPASRYNGWFVEDVRTKPASYTKILHSLSYFKDKQIAPPQGLTLTGDHAYWEYADGIRLGMHALPDAPGIRLQSTKAISLTLRFDIRGIYQHPQFGREYTIQVVPGGVFITYNDPALGRTMYVALKTDGKCSKKGRWEPVTYPWDAARHSPPGDGHIFELDVTGATWVAMGAAHTATAAQKACKAADRAEIPMVGIGIAHSHDTITEEVKAARYASAQTLEILGAEAGTYAGLPWFHQVWTRDELIAALGMTREHQLAIIQKYAAASPERGELPTFVESGTTCADGVGWLALLIREYGLADLTTTDRKKITAFLTKVLKDVRKNAEGLIQADDKATWMDTINRGGYRIEIQTMYGLCLELLGELTGDKTWTKQYSALKEQIRTSFLKRGTLWDGTDDETVRPNCFIAYLCMPSLLTAQEWERVFGTALSALRTTWGGLTSLDQRDPGYQSVSTGQDNRSYHRGDSWFFMNNLAGVALNRIGLKQFKPVVQEILKSSTEEILWKHVVGQAGEIASGKDGASWGCGTQAFSAGTYRFLTDELSY